MADKDDPDRFKVQRDERGRLYVELSPADSLMLSVMSIRFGLTAEGALALGNIFRNSPGLLEELRRLAETNKPAAKVLIERILKEARKFDRESGQAN